VKLSKLRQAQLCSCSYMLSRRSRSRDDRPCTHGPLLTKESRLMVFYKLLQCMRAAVCTGVRRTWWICLEPTSATASELSREGRRQPKVVTTKRISECLGPFTELAVEEFVHSPHSVTRDALIGSCELQLIRPTLRTEVLALIIVLLFRPCDRRSDNYSFCCFCTCALAV